MVQLHSLTTSAKHEFIKVNGALLDDEIPWNTGIQPPRPKAENMLRESGKRRSTRARLHTRTWRRLLDSNVFSGLGCGVQVLPGVRTYPCHLAVPIIQCTTAECGRSGRSNYCLFRYPELQSCVTAWHTGATTKQGYSALLTHVKDICATPY